MLSPLTFADVTWLHVFVLGLLPFLLKSHDLLGDFNVKEESDTFLDLAIFQGSLSCGKDKKKIELILYHVHFKIKFDFFFSFFF